MKTTTRVSSCVIQSRYNSSYTLIPCPAQHKGQGQNSNTTATTSTNNKIPSSLQLAWVFVFNSMVSKSYKEWIEDTFIYTNRTQVVCLHMIKRGTRKYAYIAL